MFGVAFGAVFIDHNYLTKAANQTLQNRKEERTHELPKVELEEEDEKGTDK